MLVFTWNLKRNDRAFRLALDYLSQCNDAFIAVLQELPTLADSTLKAQPQTLTLSRQRVQCLGIVGSPRTPGRLGVFSSPSVTQVGAITADSNNRTAMTVLRTPGGVDFSVVGVHAVDRRTAPTPYARGALGQIMRFNIEIFWNSNWPLIVLGDFNADPYHDELSSCLGLFALRDRDETKRAWDISLLGKSMRPLYNPMWRLLPESQGQPAGTFRLKSHDQGIRWRLCDQILVSQELIAKLNGSPQSLAKIGQTKLLTKQGSPRTKAISDHLPVELSMSV